MLGASQRSCAISVFVLPRATHVSTSRSRAVRPRSGGGSSRRSASPTRSTISRRSPQWWTSGRRDPDSSHSTSDSSGANSREQPPRRLGGVLDLATGAEEDHPAGLVRLSLVETDEGCRQLAARPRGLPEPGEVGLEKVEDEPVALAECSLGPVEEERLPVGRRGGDVDLELVLDAVRAEHDVVETSSVQLASGLEVRDLEGAEVSLPARSRMGVSR